MRNILVVSFDLISPEEPDVSLSIASFVAAAKSSPLYQKAFQIHHRSFNLAKEPGLRAETVVDAIAREHDLGKLDLVGISCYVWCEFLVNPVISLMREAGYRAPILLGGPQIDCSQSLQTTYPGCQIFIEGYAERSFLQAIEHVNVAPPALVTADPGLAACPSPYLTGEIPVVFRQGKVRLETKRGCPHRCSFCAHRDLHEGKVRRRPNHVVFEELAFLQERGVRKVNVVDPVFNSGPDHLRFLEELVGMGAKYLVSLQTRFEGIRGEQGRRFLDLCANLNVCLEFGLQSIIEEECAVVNRRNDVAHVEHILEAMNEKAIRYEVSLIYGLPKQTLRSFERSVKFLRDNGCPVVKAYPLMLLKGTELWAQREKWGLREEPVGQYHMPLVVQSNSFDRQEWNEMQAVADALQPAGRYQGKLPADPLLSESDRECELRAAAECLEGQAGYFGDGRRRQPRARRVPDGTRYRATCMKDSNVCQSTGL